MVCKKAAGPKTAAGAAARLTAGEMILDEIEFLMRIGV